MDRTLLTNLARQRELIEELERDGHATETARELLIVLEQPKPCTSPIGIESAPTSAQPLKHRGDAFAIALRSTHAAALLRP